MDFARIYHQKLKRFFFICFLFALSSVVSLPVFATIKLEKKQAIEQIFNHLHNQYNEPVARAGLVTPGIYILMTEKSCMSCFSDLEKYLLKNYPNIPISLIIVMPENPLIIRSKIQTVSPFFSKQPTIYFHYFDKEQNNEDTSEKQYIQFMNSPSPYFFISDKRNQAKFQFFDFKKTSELLYPKEDVGFTK